MDLATVLSDFGQVAFGWPRFYRPGHWGADILDHELVLDVSLKILFYGQCSLLMALSTESVKGAESVNVDTLKALLCSE